MILIRNKTNYSILSPFLYGELKGIVTFLNGELNLNTLAFSVNNEYIGSASYIYKNGGLCFKSIGDTNRIYVESLELALEEIISYLINEFHMT